MSIRELAEIMGQHMAAQPEVWVAPVFFKRFEIAKLQALKEPKGDFEGLSSI